METRIRTKRATTTILSARITRSWKFEKKERERKGIVGGKILLIVLFLARKRPLRTRLTQILKKTGFAGQEKYANHQVETLQTSPNLKASDGKSFTSLQKKTLWKKKIRRARTTIKADFPKGRKKA